MNDNEQRDELARELFIADNSNQPREASIVDWEWFEGTDKQRGQLEHYKNMAAGMIAAGYTKPEPVDPAEVSIINGWLVQQANECTCGGGGQECGYHHESGCGYEPLINITEPLKRAGYTLDSKPRTITTVEELDALPDGSVVMGFKQNGDQRVSTKSFGDWFVDGSDEDYPQAGLGHAHDELTVLHEPKVEAAEFAIDECNGSGRCDVSKHVHGCYSDLGRCDEPAEHEATR